MMFHINDGNGVLSTKKEFCIVIQHQIYGPFPSTATFARSLYHLLENPKDKKTREEALNVITKELGVFNANRK